MNATLGTRLTLGAFAFVAATTATAAPQEAKKSETPALKSIWKMPVSAQTKRIAAGELTDDKKQRLVALEDEGKLTIFKTTESGADKEETLEVGKKTADVHVGRYVKAKPAVIVISGAVFYRSGDKYAKKEIAAIQNVNGSVWFADGAESFFTMEMGGSPRSQNIDLEGGKLLDGPDMSEPPKNSSVYKQVKIQLPESYYDNLPLPEEVKKGKQLGLLSRPDDKNIYVMFAWQEANGAYLALADGSAIFEGGGAEVKPLHKSQKLAGKTLDYAFGVSPKDGKQKGVFVLTEAGEGGKERQVEFFALE